MLEEPTLVFLDSDTVLTGEPNDLDLPSGTDIALRPAQSDRLNSLGPGDPVDTFWQRVFDDRMMDDVPFVQNELGRRVRAFFSAGLVAVRREAGVFREWENDLRRLVSRGVVFEGAFHRMDEIALAATVVRRFARTLLLGPSYNYLIFKRPIMVAPLNGLPLNQIVHIHYRSAFEEPGFLRSVDPPFDRGCPIFRWLERSLPLKSSISDQGEPA